MKTKQLKKLTDFIENEIVNHVEGVREEGDITNENRRFPDTYYYDSFQAIYDKENKEISFYSEMVADTGEFDEDGLPVYHENAFVHVEYDIINDSISVKAESEDCYDDDENEDVEYMKGVLFNLECRIEEDKDFLELLKKETSHLRPEEEEEPVTDTIMWQGQGCICEFAIYAEEHGFKHLIKCHPLTDDCQKDLAAACWDDEELLRQIQKFSYAGYSCQIELIANIDINELKTKVCG